ncbi:DUF2293 domain-containing protein, partial [Mycobacterium tuberculosis]|nr:DUF2293 domain-containing protein [Mycobacterium tuberculosis]
SVAASVRHIDTAFDELLMSGVDRETAHHLLKQLAQYFLF